MLLQKQIIFFGQSAMITCDGRCEKAWGIGSRPSVQLSELEDAFEWLSDTELGIAPIDPGTYEGSDGKPTHDGEQLNRWCARECERSSIDRRTIGNTVRNIVLRDFNRRVCNFHSRRKEEGNEQEKEEENERRKSKENV